MVAQPQGNDPLPFPRTRKGGIPKAVLASRVFDCIPVGDKEAPVSRADLCALSGLTVAQVKAGLEYIRDHHPDLPLVHTAAGYRFTTDADSVTANRIEGVRSVLTRMRRLWDGLVNPYISQPGFNQRDLKRVTKQFERVIEDLADILA